MATNGIGTGTQVRRAALRQRRVSWVISGWALRLIIAFIISWLIVLAFFATNVASR